MTQVTVNGQTYSDAGESAKDMRDGGHRTHLLPMVSDVMVAINAAGLSGNSVVTVTGTGAQSVTNTQGTIVWAPSTPADATFTLPASPTVGQAHTFKYRLLSIPFYRMTIAASSGMTIDGAASIVLTLPFDEVTLRYTATNQWSRVSGQAWHNPVLAADVATGGTSGRAVVVVGRYAYAALTGGAAGGLFIYDVSRPNSPTLVSRTTITGDPARGLAVSGRYAYLATGDTAACLKIYDVSNATAPSLVGSLNIGSASASALSLSGRYLYIGTSANLRIVDVANPAAPVLLSTLALTGLSFITAITVTGKYALVGSSTAASVVHIIDISDPAAPVSVGTYTPTNAVTAITVAGKYAYLAETTAASGLQVIDISNPVSPATVATFATAQGAQGAHMPLAGSYLYFPGGFGTGNGQIIDISNPAVPVAAGSWTNNNNIHDLWVSGKYLWQLDFGAPLRVYALPGATLPGAAIGVLEVDGLTVNQAAIFDRDIYVNGGLHAGLHGLHSRGGLSVGGKSYFGADVGIGMTSPQASLSLGVGKNFRNYNSFTDASNGEWGEFSWASNVLNIGTNQNGTGTARDVSIRRGGVEAIRLASSTVTITNPTLSGTTTLSGMTTGSVLFAGTASALSQDNANLFWDDTNNRLGVGTASPQMIFQVRTKPANSGWFTAESTAGALLTSLNNNGGSTPAAAEAVLVLAREGISGQAFANFARFDLSRYENVGTNPRTQLDIKLAHETLNTEANSTPTIITLQSSGNVGIGMTSPQSGLSLGTGKDLRVYNSFTDASNGEWGEFSWSSNVLNIGTNQNGTGAARALSLRTAGTEAIRIDTSQRVLFGSSSSFSGPSAFARQHQFYSNTGIQLGRHSADSFGPELAQTKSRNAIAGSHTAVAAEDGILALTGAGSDGANYQYATQIIGTVDGAVSAGIVPGRLTFLTATSAGTLTERLRITSGGLVTFGGATSSFPALKRSSTTLQTRLADDSAYAPFEASDLSAKNVTSSLGLGTDSAGKLVSLAQRARSTAVFTANSGSTGNTLTNITGLSAALAAGGIYIIRGTLHAFATGNGGLKMALSNGDTLTATSIRYSVQFTTGGNAAGGNASALGDAVGSLAAVVTAIFSGVIVVNAAGTLTVQAAQNASHADTTTVFANSFLEVVKIG